MGMENIKIEEINGLYKITDETDGGYVTRVSRYICHWQTIWNDKLELLEFYFHNEERTSLLKDKDDFDHHRAIRAKGRHLRALKVHLGLIEEKKPKETQPILYKEVGWSFSEDIKSADAIIHEKTLEMRGSSYKKAGYRYVIATDEKNKLALEYNQKLKEFEKYKKEIFDKIFDN